MYEKSAPIEGEPDIFVFADPEWSNPDFPLGLSLFDPEHNVACVLGMRYFGELKKGTLTLAWGIAGRHGWCSCHGGQKRYNLPGGKKFVSAVFGLSGSGKSTITHAKHDNKYDVTVLHDDASVSYTHLMIKGARDHHIHAISIGIDFAQHILAGLGCRIDISWTHGVFFAYGAFPFAHMPILLSRAHQQKPCLLYTSIVRPSMKAHSTEKPAGRRSIPPEPQQALTMEKPTMERAAPLVICKISSQWGTT